LSFLNFFQTPRGRAIVETGCGERAVTPDDFAGFAGRSMPQDLIYLAQAESAFQPLALSRAGARGIWQFVAWRGNEYGLRHTWWVDERQIREGYSRGSSPPAGPLFDVRRLVSGHGRLQLRTGQRAERH